MAPCLYRALDRIFSYKKALVIYARNHRHFVGANTCSCSSCGRKSFSTKNTASSSKAAVYVPLGLRHSHEASMPSNTAPRTRVDASVVTTTRDVSLCHSLRDSMLPRETAMRKRPEVHAVQGTQKFTQNFSGRMYSKLSGLKWSMKTKWRPGAPDRGETAPGCHYRLTVLYDLVEHHFVGA